MEPFSIATGIIGILAAIDQAQKCLHKLRDVRNAHNEITEVVEEVTDLHRMLKEVSQLVTAAPESGLSLPNEVVETLDCLGRRTTHKLGALKKLIPACALELSEDNGWRGKMVQNTRLNFVKKERWSWSRNRAQVFRIREDLQRLQLNILVKVSLISAYTGFQLLRSPIIALSETFTHQETTTSTANPHPQSAESTGSELVPLGSDSNAGERNPVFLAAVEATDLITDPLLRKPAINRHVPEIAYTSSSPPVPCGQTWKRQFQIRSGFSNVCEVFCSCPCHKEAYVVSPRSWNSFFGDFSISSNGIIFTNPACKEASCSRNVRRALKFAYRPPRWLLSVNFQLSYSSDSLYGPEIRIRLPRTVGFHAPIWNAVIKGDLERIKEMIADNEASLADVNPNGGSLLHYAADRCYFDICQYLLELGVMPDIADCVGGYPTKFVWEYYLMGKLTEDQKLFVRSAFDDEYLQSRQFTVLHKVVLGLTNLDIDLMLKASTADINVTDAEKRTCLSWAASRADEKSVETLLRFGADPNIPDNFNRTPLHYVQSAQCCKLLLKYSAEVEAKEIGGGTPLNLAVSPPGNIAVAESLLGHGANIHIYDTYGNTPLITAIYNGYEDCTLAILEKFNFEVDNAAKLMKVIGAALFYGSDKIFKYLRDLLSHHDILCSSFIDSLPGSAVGDAVVKWFNESRVNLATHLSEDEQFLKYLRKAENEYKSVYGPQVSGLLIPEPKPEIATTLSSNPEDEFVEAAEFVKRMSEWRL